MSTHKWKEIDSIPKLAILYKCEICKMRAWNVTFQRNNFLTCEEYIMKNVLE